MQTIKATQAARGIPRATAEGIADAIDRCDATATYDDLWDLLDSIRADLRRALYAPSAGDRVVWSNGTADTATLWLTATVTLVSKRILITVDTPPVGWPRAERWVRLDSITPTAE